MNPKTELSDALIKYEICKTAEGRQRLIQDLPDTISAGISHNAQPLIHIRNLVDRCSAVPGGLRALVDTLRDYERGTRSSLKIIRLALGIELLEIIVAEELDESHATAFFLNSLPRLQRHREAETIWQQLTLLWQMRPLPGEISPILRFVDQLSESVAWSETELRAWRIWAIQQPSLNLQEGVASANTGQEIGTNPYLTIVVKPLPGDGRTGEYLVTTYLWTNDKDVMQLNTTGRIVHPRQELPALVATALEEAQHLLRYRIPDLTIEFCLPYELMSDDVDQLSKPDPQVGERCLGTLYPVIVRPFYRLMDSGESRGWWEARWHNIKRRILDQNPDEAQVWICAEDEQLLDRVVVRLTDRSQKICFLGLPFTPAGKMGELSIFTEMMRAGIPVALWPRLRNAQMELPDIHSLLSELLSDECLAELPNHLQSRRLNVHANRQHPGNHMTLLWDDADRIPPPFPGGARPFRPSDL